MAKSSKKSVQHTIGPKVRIDFLDPEINAVPAKVDTGADSSSVWASGIKEVNGKLHFYLFDQQSPYFTGEEVIVSNFKSTMVKNSFGESQLRYKVPLRINLDGRKIKATFTLADRSRNKYPVLIGRITLKNKFIVDVAKVDQVTDPTEVLVLTYDARPKISSQLNNIQKTSLGKIKASVASYKNIRIIVDSKELTITNTKTGRDLASYNFIHFLTRVKEAELAAIIAHYAKKHNINFADQVAEMLPTDSKIHQAVLLSGRNVNIPKTVYMDTANWEGAYDEIVRELGSPFIFKDNNGRKGRSNFLIKSDAEYKSANEQALQSGIQMVAQKYVPNNGYYRLVFMSNEIVLGMYRNVDTERSHLYKKSLDGEAILIEPQKLPSVATEIAMKSSNLLGLNLAGVDVFQDIETNEWYCIEVNNSPQLVGGAFVDEKMQELAKFYLKESKK